MLNNKSIVKDLNLYAYQIDISRSINDLTKYLQANPTLPGAILFNQDIFLGAISQKDFWQYMSRPYSLELSSKRKIKDLLKFFDLDCLIISKDSLIIEATERSLQRSSQLLEQPIIVQFTSVEYRLLDSHQLLVAYAKIHRLTNRLLEQTNQKLEQTNYKLEKTLRLDKVTGLGNTLLFEEYFEREWERIVNEESWISLIRFDLDLFQEDLKNYSQLTLNGCLRKIGVTIELLLNRGKDLAIHYGDGRFAIIIPNSNTIDSTSIGKEIASSIQQLQIINAETKISTNLSLNLGIASIKPRAKDEREQLLIAAEMSLEKAKIIGKNCQIIKDISYSELKKEDRLPALNRKAIKLKLDRPSGVSLNTDREDDTKLSQAV